MLNDMLCFSFVQLGRCGVNGLHAPQRAMEAGEIVRASV